MGLIKMGINALSGTLADQTVEVFECQNFDQKTLMRKATMRNAKNNKATDAYISSGSVFHVAINQAALLVEDGKVWDMVIGSEDKYTGPYKYDSASAPSILGSGFKDLLPSIKEIGSRFTTGGTSKHTMRLVYINLKPIIGIPVGFGNVPFRDGEMNLSLNAQGHGSCELKIVDPGMFYENCVQSIDKDFRIDEGDGAAFISQLKNDMKPKFGIALTKVIAAKRVPYDQMIAYADDLAEAMNEALNDKWTEKGIALNNLSVELNVDDASKERIAKYQEQYADIAVGAAAAQNPAALYGMDRMSINRARETAAGNTAGAMTGFMGMGMAGGGMMGQPMDPTMYQQQMMMQQQGGGMYGQPQQGMYGQQPQQPQQPQQAAPAPAGDSWTCECGASNTGKFCMECGKPQPAPAPAAAPAAEGWTCSCGTVNQGKFCMNCGSKKPADAPLYKCDKCGWQPDDPKNPPKFCPQCGDVFDDNDIQ